MYHCTCKEADADPVTKIICKEGVCHEFQEPRQVCTSLRSNFKSSVHFVQKPEKHNSYGSHDKG